MAGPADPEHPHCDVEIGDVIVFDRHRRNGGHGGRPELQPTRRLAVSDTIEIALDGFCPGEDVGCGVASVAPKTGANGVVYVALSPDGSSSGGVAVAIASDGRIVDGWPVGLTRRGAGLKPRRLRSMVVSGRRRQARRPRVVLGTLLSIAPDSTIRGKLIVEP